MKLLFDHNLSPRLVNYLTDLYPTANHVAFVGLDQASDELVWNFARQYGYTIVTKDSDFNDLSLVWGSPPKVIWLRVGNKATRQIEVILRQQVIAIQVFLQDPSATILTIL